MSEVIIGCGDAREELRKLPANWVHTTITSPPFWGLRAYGTTPQMWGDGWVGELGSEPTLEQYVAHIVEVFREVKRVLRDDGTLWLELGDSYACSPNGRTAAATKAVGKDDRTFRDKPVGTAGNGLKPKDLCGVPWAVAFALRGDGWWLRSDCIWSRTNPMPSSVKDRPATSHSYIFLLSKKAKYYYDAEAVREPAQYGRRKWKGRSAYEIYDADSAGKRETYTTSGGDPTAGRNRRTVWTFPTQPFSAKKVGVEDVDHFATFPEALVEPCVLAGTSEGGCCAACGAPYRRVIEEGEPDREWQLACGGDAQGEYHGQATKDFAAAGAEDASAIKSRILAGMVEKRTVGWESTCECAERAQTVEVSVLAGTSAEGCCARCGAPLERIVEPTPEYAALFGSNKGADADRGGKGYRKHSLAVTADYRTIGWKSTCACVTKPVPCVVLDPFAGSGTVGVVASRLGRHALLLELNEQYCEIVRRRCGDAVVEVTQ